MITRVLVTGGCGFIGSNLVRHLLSQTTPELHVINLDALTYAGNPDNLTDLQNHPRYHFLQGDICDRERVRSLFAQRPDGVFHLAAESHVDRSIHNSEPFIRTNVYGTQVLLDAAREFSIPRFIHVSTDEVYGSLGPAGAFTEESPLAPNSPYAATKAASDCLVRAAHHTYGLPAIITRCSNNYGPYQFPEKLIPLFITNLLRNEPVPVYGDGLQVRDWLHVQDHCAALYRVWQDGRVGAVYNIGGRRELTNLDLTRTLLTILNKPDSLIRHVPDRPGHDRRYAIDCTRIEHELGWAPQVAFEVGLRETVHWYKGHPEWIEKIRRRRDPA